VAVSTSQPLVAAPSQSPKPAAHEATAHTPAAQPATPPATRHTLSQRPQWAGLAARSKHPSPHTAWPAGQRSVHAPIAHTRPAAQALPQAPQWALAPARLTSQPLAASPSQSPKPAAQRSTRHAPPAQVAVALGRAQPRPHMPQWAAVTRVSTSQPLAASPSQSPKPAAHAATPQTPPTQAAIALAGAHPRPHAPQWAAVTRVSTSQPLAASPSQSPKPAAQSGAQRPATHRAVALAGAPQERSQAPQWAASASRSRQAAPQGSWPVAHTRRQAPSTHELPAAQALPQAPQLATSAARVAQ
jgi:hypothetical protein